MKALDDYPEHIQKQFTEMLLRKLKISIYRSNIKSNINAIRWNLYHIKRKLDKYINMVNTWARR